MKHIFCSKEFLDYLISISKRSEKHEFDNIAIKHNASKQCR